MPVTASGQLTTGGLSGMIVWPEVDMASGQGTNCFRGLPILGVFCQ